ncbi:MAG: RtcB family protein [Clostridiales bacterium]|jgi:hypothetical protein|nr:RtcB family protein [Clostridiales bacterium]
MRTIGPDHIFNAAHSWRELSVAERIKRLPGVSRDIVLSPESKYDKNGDLTGIMFRSEGDGAIAYPGLVPDNGCGFCLALIKGVRHGGIDWNGFAESLILAAGVYSVDRRNSTPDDLFGAMVLGLPNLENHFFFNLAEQAEKSDFYKSLVMDEAMPILLKQPFGCFLGHFLEIRKPESGGMFRDDEYILIIHAGSQGIHRLLNNLLHERHHYHSRVYGAPLSNQEGQDRKLSAQMAMNYSRASRLHSLKIISERVYDYFGAETFFLSDIFHSYIQYEDGGILHCRGVQNADCPYNDSEFPYCLLGGTLSTSSYILSPTVACASICHGTPEAFYSDPMCERFDSPDTLAWKDTSPRGDPRLFESVTRELANWFETQGCMKICARLLPVFNMQLADK